MKKEKKRFDWNRCLFNTVFFLTCGVAGIIGGRYAAEDEQGPIMVILAFLVSFFMHTVIHESGHLVYGLATGYKFLSFRIGSIILVKQNGKLRLKLYSLVGTGGQCLLTPPDMKDGKTPYVMYNLGGIMMNTMVSCLTMMFYFASAFPENWSPYVIIFSFYGFAAAILNGIPFRTGAANNDGYNTLELSKSPKAVRSLWIQMKVNALNVEGIRAKDMPEKWFEVPEEDDMKNSIVSTMGVFACSRLMDMHRFDEAEKLIEKMLSSDYEIAEIYRSLMTADLVYCKVIKGTVKDEINTLLTKQCRKMLKAMKNHPSAIRTEYVLALINENDREKAEKKRFDFEKCVKTYPYPADIESERELMKIAAEKLSEERK